MIHDTNNLACMSSKKITLSTIKKFVKNKTILARINSHFTDYTRLELVKRSKEFLKVTFDIEKNKIRNCEGIEIFELSSYTRNLYQIYEDENFIGYTISNCVADITIVMLKK